METLLDIVTKTQNTLRRNFRSPICTYVLLNSIFGSKYSRIKKNEYNFLILYEKRKFPKVPMPYKFPESFPSFTTLVTALSFLYKMVRNRDIGRVCIQLGILRYITFERFQTIQAIL